MTRPIEILITPPISFPLPLAHSPNFFVRSKSRDQNSTTSGILPIVNPSLGSLIGYSSSARPVHGPIFASEIDRGQRGLAPTLVEQPVITATKMAPKG
jgi:hypothetical protein